MRSTTHAICCGTWRIDSMATTTPSATLKNGNANER